MRLASTSQFKFTSDKIQKLHSITRFQNFLKTKKVVISKMKSRTINILGTEYQILIQNKKQNPKLENANGLCEYYSKKIILDDFEGAKEDVLCVENLEEFKKKVLRHEIIHAFLGESGLRASSEWAENEEMVDFFAIQFPKILQAFRDAGAIQREQSNSQCMQDAAKLIRHEFKTNPESYKALISSIESSLRDVPMHAWDSEKAEMIAKRIIGD